MRQTAENIAAKKKADEPKPPNKPKFRTLSRVAKNDYSMPWVIYQGVDDLTEDNLLNGDNFVVELAPIKYKDRLRYERENGESIDEVITKIVWVLDRMYNMLSNEISDEERLKIAQQLTRDDMGRYETPMGYLWGSLDLNVSQLCLYILACRGRIVGKDADGWVLESVSQEDLLEVIEGNPFLEPNDNGVPRVIEILDAAGLYNIEELNKAQAELSAATEGEPVKKGASPKKKGGPRTAKTSAGSSTTE